MTTTNSAFSKAWTGKLILIIAILQTKYKLQYFLKNSTFKTSDWICVKVSHRRRDSHLENSLLKRMNEKGWRVFKELTGIIKSAYRTIGRYVSKHFSCQTENVQGNYWSFFTLQMYPLVSQVKLQLTFFLNEVTIYIVGCLSIMIINIITWWMPKNPSCQASRLQNSIGGNGN